ncbi:tRNA-modifying protein YgfZ [Vibrio sp. SM6]|uniref:tRNA-modifying protein YgfZ n=1 Tax=Vibrio agarilyticus TaxID=2726741 RepID=A0A7X8TQ28_9VIBR|nr:tRNA-modifying protein YgfZ [Vibrio agarilyticus]NLS12852.1 tRNA-modifying protein YgfZ [Vibrio agarilyticus]
MDWQNLFSPLALAQNASLPALSLALLQDIQAITLVGDDKKSYLQGQVTCDVVTLPANQSTLGAHCDAKGKVWSVFRLFHHGEGYAMVQDAAVIDVELREIQKYAVFSKVTIERSTDIAFGVLGPHAQAFIDALTPESSADDDVRPLESGTAVKVGEQRWLLLVKASAVESIIAAAREMEPTLALTTQALWDLTDIEAGMPRLTAAQQNSHIPQALNLQALNGISFTKGCYTGQETVARAKYRGINKRALYRVTTDAMPNIAQPWSLERQVGENWRHAGELLIGYQFADGAACGLIVLPNDLEANTLLRLAQAPESQWHLADLPYAVNEPSA